MKTKSAHVTYVLGGMSHPNKFIIKIIKMKKYIQIANFQLSFFFSNLRVYISSGPEKEGVQVDGLDGLRFMISPQISSYTCSAMQEKGISEKP